MHSTAFHETQFSFAGRRSDRPTPASVEQGVLPDNFLWSPSLGVATAQQSVLMVTASQDCPVGIEELLRSVEGAQDEGELLDDKFRDPGPNDRHLAVWLWDRTDASQQPQLVAMARLNETLEGADPASLPYRWLRIPKQPTSVRRVGFINRVLVHPKYQCRDASAQDPTQQWKHIGKLVMSSVLQLAFYVGYTECFCVVRPSNVRMESILRDLQFRVVPWEFDECRDLGPETVVPTYRYALALPPFQGFYADLSIAELMREFKDDRGIELVPLLTPDPERWLHQL